MAKFLKLIVAAAPIYLAVNPSTAAAQTERFVRTMPNIVVESVNPQYPAAALTHKLVGNGAADVTVDSHGFPTAVKLVSWENVNAAGPALGLDTATLEAIRRWRFKPLRVDGAFVGFEVRIGFVVRPDGVTWVASTPEPRR